MKHFTKEEQKKYTESIRKVFNLPEEYLRRADEKSPSDSKELKKDYLKLRSENTLLGERCNQLLTDKGKLTDRVQELEAENSTVWTMIKEKDKQIGEFEKLPRKVKELEAQIEKMKCCGNCDVGDKACYVRTQEHVNICPSWKLKEVKENDKKRNT